MNDNQPKSKRLFQNMVKKRGKEKEVLIPEQLMNCQETKVYEQLQCNKPFAQKMDYPHSMKFSSDVETVGQIRDMLREQVYDHRKHDTRMNSVLNKKMLESVYRPNQQMSDRQKDNLNSSVQDWLRITGAYKWGECNMTERLKLQAIH
jgi:hypothetical protein